MLPRQTAILDEKQPNTLTPSVNPHHGEHQHNHTTCPHFVEREEYIDILNSFFFDRAVSSRVLVWGTGGIGKRQIAIHFANRHAKATGKVVLWVECASVESFVRDYQRLFYQITGTVLAKSLDIFQMLRKVRRALEARRSEWILVLLDVNRLFVQFSSVLGTTLVNHLPEGGQILATTSEIIVELNDGPDTLSCSLEMEGFSLVRVSEWNEKEVSQYLNLRKVVVKDKETDDSLGDPSEWTPLMTAISCSSLQYLELPTEQYRSYFRRMLRKMTGVPGRPMLRPISPVFSTILNIAWSALQDLDEAALDLLLYLSAVWSDEVPLDLLRLLKPFKESAEDRLSRGISLLVSMSLLTTYENGSVRLHGLVRRWMELKLREIHGNRYSIVVSHWISAINAYLADPKPEPYVTSYIIEPPGQVDQTKRRTDEYWQLIPHLQVLSHSAFMFRIEGPLLLSWIGNMARFMTDDCIFHKAADILTTRAYLRHSPAVGIHLCLSELHQYLNIKEMKVKALLKCAKYREAEREITRVVRWIGGSGLEGIPRARAIETFRGYDIEVLMRMAEYRTCLQVLDMQNSSLHSPFETAQRHFRIGLCLLYSDETDAALKHSHAAMAYWNKSEEKWENQEMLKWVELHSVLFLKKQKTKGALKYLKPLLDVQLDLYEYSSDRVWSTVDRMVTAYCMDPETYAESEALMIRVLSNGGVGQPVGSGLTSYLHALSQVADMFRNTGRDLEAEALYRRTVHCMTQQVFDGTLDAKSHDFRVDRILLIACLEEQGKFEECRKYRSRFLDLGLDDDMQNELRMLRRLSKSHRFIYDHALEALELGRDIEEIVNFGSADRKRLDGAIIRFGSPEERMKNDRHLTHDLEIFGIGKAKKSRLLHLVGFDVVDSCFASHDRTSFFSLLPDNQRLITEYFDFCYCRRYRKRSPSLTLLDILAIRFSIIDDKDKTFLRTYTQKPITEWLVPRSKESPTQDPGNSVSGPIRKLPLPTANSSSIPLLIDWPKKDKPKHEPVLKSQAFDISPGDLLCLDSVSGTITWTPAAFNNGDCEDENYIIPDALHLPSIKIWLPSGDTLSEFTTAGIHVTYPDSEEPRKVTDFFPKSKIQEGVPAEVANFRRPRRLSDVTEVPESDRSEWDGSESGGANSVHDSDD